MVQRFETIEAQLYQMVSEWIAKNVPDLLKPFEILTVDATPSSGATTLHAGGTTFDYHWLVPYGATATGSNPAAGQKIIVLKSSSGPLILGRVS